MSLHISRVPFCVLFLSVNSSTEEMFYFVYVYITVCTVFSFCIPHIATCMSTL